MALQLIFTSRTPFEEHFLLRKHKYSACTDHFAKNRPIFEPLPHADDLRPVLIAHKVRETFYNVAKVGSLFAGGQNKKLLKSFVQIYDCLDHHGSPSDSGCTRSKAEGSRKCSAQRYVCKFSGKRIALLEFYTAHHTRDLSFKDRGKCRLQQRREKLRVTFVRRTILHRKNKITNCVKFLVNKTFTNYAYI